MSAYKQDSSSSPGAQQRTARVCLLAGRELTHLTRSDATDEPHAARMTAGAQQGAQGLPGHHPGTLLRCGRVSVVVRHAGFPCGSSHRHAGLPTNPRPLLTPHTSRHPPPAPTSNAERTPSATQVVQKVFSKAYGADQVINDHFAFRTFGVSRQQVHAGMHSRCWRTANLLGCPHPGPGWRMAHTKTCTHAHNSSLPSDANYSDYPGPTPPGWGCHVLRVPTALTHKSFVVCKTDNPVCRCQAWASSPLVPPLRRSATN